MMRYVWPLTAMASLVSESLMQFGCSPTCELIGVGDVISDYRVKAAAVLGLPVFASLPEKADEMQAAGGVRAGARRLVRQLRKYFMFTGGLT